MARSISETGTSNHPATLCVISIGLFFVYDDKSMKFCSKKQICGQSFYVNLTDEGLIFRNHTNYIIPIRKIECVFVQ
jgi:hypothetical protein